MMILVSKKALEQFADERQEARGLAELYQAKTNYWRNRALHKKHGIQDPILSNPDARTTMRPREVVVTDDKLLPEHRKKAVRQ